MTDIVKGMARASYEAVSIKNSYADTSPATQEVCEEAMHAALLWLADNLTEEMILPALRIYEPFFTRLPDDNSDMRLAIAAAIRAAAGEEGK
jgi:hypothetical protein